MRLAIVVQRYGADIVSGAELHARNLAELLHGPHHVEVFTTCAQDYVTWRNHYPPGSTFVGPVRVHRFPVRRPRDPRTYGRWEQYLLTHPHSEADEYRWLELEGPYAPRLIEAIRRRAADFDFWLFFSFRYYTTFHGVRAVPDRAILVPTAEEDPIIGFSIFRRLFHGVRGIAYNSIEEQRLIQGMTRNYHVPGVVVGIHVQPPPDPPCPERFRQQWNVSEPYVLFVGRVDVNKGAPQLVEMFAHYAASRPNSPLLVLLGPIVDSVPPHPRIRLLGPVDEQTKWDALAGCEFLINPSPLESLSMVLLEAWKARKAVLVNGQCAVLRGQCIRSNGGLFYTSPAEFHRMMDWLLEHPDLRQQLGENGRTYVDEHYRPDSILRKYEELFERARSVPETRVA
jgi:glycosyltransferase involved in cell wall biosynthesis